MVHMIGKHMDVDSGLSTVSYHPQEQDSEKLGAR